MNKNCGKAEAKQLYAQSYGANFGPFILRI
jgi:hypothetical protein